MDGGVVKKSLPFRQDPHLQGLPFTAAVLDFFWGLPLPWKHPLFMWVLFMSVPLWFGVVAAVVFFAFLSDVLFRETPK